MQYRAPRLSLSALLLAALLSLFGSSPTADAQIRIVEPGASSQAAGERSAAVESLVRQGSALESENRWGDALAHYEEALRDFPHDEVLARRREFAKINYELGRRYDDDSFRKALISFRVDEALDQYSEVLLKIETHYVDRPDWTRLVERGTRAMEIALARDDFRRRHLPNVAAERIDAFARAMRRTVGSTTTRTRDEARTLVASLASHGEHAIGLPAVATVFEFTCGAIGGLDNYSAYLTSGQLKDVYSQIDGNFVGLGIELKADDGSLLIVNVIPGSPADRAGLRANDRIVAVDRQSTREISTDSAANLLQGPEGSIAEVTIHSPDRDPRTVRVRREHVEVPSVDNIKIVDAEAGVAYLRLVSFQRTTNRDMDRALWQLHRQGMKSLIIDLRGNPGGLLSASVEVADKFVDRGTIVSTKGRNTAEDYRYTAHQIATWRVPLVVLIDGNSASASEIFAGAIRDHRRGTIIGERSYGKGSVQGIFPLAVGGCGVRLTTAKFYSPAGTPINELGVSPDVTVHTTAKPDLATADIPTGDEDRVLKAAVQVAQQQLAAR